MKRRACWTGIALAAMVAPAWGENPRLSLKVENATVKEAAAALGRAAGVSIELYDFGAGRQAAAPAADNSPRASFDWSGVSFGKALRQLCAKYDVRPIRRADSGYTLYPSFEAPPLKPVGLVEKSGIRLFVRSASAYNSRSVNFTAGKPGNSGGGSLTLNLAAELGDADADTIAGVENLTARDDHATVLTPPYANYYYAGSSNAQYPDEWNGSVTLRLPHPKAKKLQWVEGDLMVYKSNRPMKLEIALPLAEKSVRKQVGDLIVVASRYAVMPKVEREDDDGALPGPRLGPYQFDSGPMVRVRVYSPVGSRYTSRTGAWGMPPQLQGVSGKFYPATQFRGGGSSNDGRVTVYDNTWLFPNVEEAPAKLVWDLVERSQPERLLSFRLLDIPLPEDPAAAPGGAADAGAPAPALPMGERPFFEKGGGVLVSPVRLADRPAADGAVSLGLSVKTATGWSGVRWIDVEVDEGIARLPDLKPGAYRVVRKYRPREAGGLPANGRWLNGEATVTVVAGKEAALPPLQWTTAPPARK